MRCEHSSPPHSTSAADCILKLETPLGIAERVARTYQMAAEEKLSILAADADAGRLDRAPARGLPRGHAARVRLSPGAGRQRDARDERARCRVPGPDAAHRSYRRPVPTEGAQRGVRARRRGRYARAHRPHLAGPDRLDGRPGPAHVALGHRTGRSQARRWRGRSVGAPGGLVRVRPPRVAGQPGTDRARRPAAPRPPARSESAGRVGARRRHARNPARGRRARTGRREHGHRRQRRRRRDRPVGGERHGRRRVLALAAQAQSGQGAVSSAVPRSCVVD